MGSSKLMAEEYNRGATKRIFNWINKFILIEMSKWLEEDKELHPSPHKDNLSKYRVDFINLQVMDETSDETNKWQD